MAAYVYDLAQIIHQLELEPVTIVAHSLGGNIALRYTGLYPDNVRRVVAIEGLGRRRKCSRNGNNSRCSSAGRTGSGTGAR